MAAAFESRNDDVIVFESFGGVNGREDDGNVFPSKVRQKFGVPSVPT